ncbi:MAG: 3-deoxy-manno-octulosonate cytidylyltransferase [Gammaproteobacteria bacterium]|jgi:3-deoxy-manno-octulosonate cytidylyltransferase (CMP-KDO synthetase)|nr:3-deoxy-manno-octulosonate cytidylyltransferase [Gammaproteobacteria bacterium]
MTRYHVVIPARMASQRLPGKPLLPIAGKPLIEHVYRRACEATAQSVIIATDSPELQAAAKKFGAEVVMTSPAHESGSDRIAECIDKQGWPDDSLVVNLQGDEPLMPAACLEQTAELLDKTPGSDVASLYWPIDLPAEVEDPNVVKVVVDEAGHALYFSRSVVPHPRNFSSVSCAMNSGAAWKRHIGLYAYRVRALKAFTSMAPSPLESVEKLEQLRFLEAGQGIIMARACEFIPAGVDTPDDLERVRGLIAGSG